MYVLPELGFKTAFFPHKMRESAVKLGMSQTPQLFGDIAGASRWKEESVTSVCMAGASKERDWQVLNWEPLEAEAQWSQSFVLLKMWWEWRSLG